MENQLDDQITGKSKGLVYGKAIKGSYNSPFFKPDDIESKIRAIYKLLMDCESTILPEELCKTEVKVPGKVCLPSTLQSAGNDDADLTLHGPDENGNCYYNLVITGTGVVGWSAMEDSCIMTVKPI